MIRNRNMIILRKELTNFYYAWKRYLTGSFFTFIRSRKITSITIALTAILMIGLIWALKTFVSPEPVYGQTGILVRQPGFWLVSARVLRWIAGGGLLGAFIRLARKQYRYFKRLKDLLISTTSLIILSPLFAILAILIKIDSVGNVLIRQERVGKDGKIFKMWKLRTMRNNAEFETGPVWAQIMIQE